jgi:nucleoside-diphosphate-sugar epimerase
MNVLVVGGGGYVGGAVTDLLKKACHAVRVYDVLLYEEAYRKQVDFTYGDVRDTKKLLPCLKWADAVIWLAALVGDGACALNPEITISINQESVKWLAENYDGRIIFFSTCSVYGAQDVELDESSRTNPLSVYASTKLAAEEYLRNRNSAIFRLGTLFGIGDLFSRIRLDLVVNTLTIRACHHGSITVFGGDQFRPLLHVRDAAKAAVDSIEASHTGVFNLHHMNVRIADLAYQVQGHFPDVTIETTQMRFQDRRNYRVSSNKAIQVFGFKTDYSIDDGIEQVKDLMSSCRLKNIDNPRYTNQKFLSMFNTHNQFDGDNAQ